MKTQRMTEISPEGKELRRLNKVRWVIIGLAIFILITMIVAVVAIYHRWESQVGPTWAYHIYYCTDDVKARGQVEGPTRIEAMEKVQAMAREYEYDVWPVGEPEPAISRSCGSSSTRVLPAVGCIIFLLLYLVGASMGGVKQWKKERF